MLLFVVYFSSNITKLYIWYFTLPSMHSHPYHITMKGDLPGVLRGTLQPEACSEHQAPATAQPREALPLKGIRRLFCLT